MGGWLAAGTFFPVGDFTGLNFLFSHCFWQAGQQCRTLLPLRLNVELTLCLTGTDWTHQRGFSPSTLQWLFARVVIGPIGSHVLLPTASTGHEDIWLASFGSDDTNALNVQTFWLSIAPNFFFFELGGVEYVQCPHGHVRPFQQIWQTFCVSCSEYVQRQGAVTGPCISPTIPHMFSINRAPRGALNLRRVAAGGFMIFNS